MRKRKPFLGVPSCGSSGRKRGSFFGNREGIFFRKKKTIIGINRIKIPCFDGRRIGGPLCCAHSVRAAHASGQQQKTLKQHCQPCRQNNDRLIGTDGFFPAKSCSASGFCRGLSPVFFRLYPGNFPEQRLHPGTSRSIMRQLHEINPCRVGFEGTHSPPASSPGPIRPGNRFAGVFRPRSKAAVPRNTPALRRMPSESVRAGRFRTRFCHEPACFGYRQRSRSS